jgi:hypothetical protein
LRANKTMIDCPPPVTMTIIVQEPTFDGIVEYEQRGTVAFKCAVKEEVTEWVDEKKKDDNQ